MLRLDICTSRHASRKTHSECKIMGQGRSVEVLKDGVLEVWKFEACSGANEIISLNVNRMLQEKHCRVKGQIKSLLVKDQTAV